MKRLRIGIIGAGGICARVHLPSLITIPEAEVCAICDLKEEKARALAEKYSIPNVYTLYGEMLSACALDAVFVLVEPDRAFRIARDCLAMGVHVFLEKPSGIALYQAETLLRTARASGAKCQVGFNRRFIPLIQEVLKRLRECGPIHQVDGYFYKHGDAAFYDGCASAFVCDTVHVVDLVRHIAGAKDGRCALVAARYGDSPVDNAWNGVIAFDNSVTGTVRANYETGGRVHGVAIHAGKASAYVDLGFGAEACSARILYHKVGTFSLSSSGAGEQHIEEIDGMALAGSREYFNYYGYKNEDRAFVTALLAGEDVPCDIAEAATTMALVEKMLASLI